MQQNNTQAGPMVVLAGADLTGLENTLVKLTTNGGSPAVAEAIPPSNILDEGLYLLTDGGADTEKVAVEALVSGQQYRLPLVGTCAPGDKLCLAPSTDWGKVIKLPATAGTYQPLFIAEEVGAAGQAVKCRYVPGMARVTVSS